MHRSANTPVDFPIPTVSCPQNRRRDTHAATLLDWQGARWIFDPGFHIVQPLPRPQDAPEARYRTPDNPNASRIVRTGPARFDCFTGHAGNWQYRFTLKDENLTPDEYKRRWLGSFQSEMMGYPVLTRFADNRMVYLQKSNLVFRDLTEGHVEKLHVGDLKDTITAHYGIAPAIATRALGILKHA